MESNSDRKRTENPNNVAYFVSAIIASFIAGLTLWILTRKKNGQ